MSKINHPDYADELERLKFTLVYVEESLDELTGRKGIIDTNVEKGKKHFNSDSSQQYIDLMINTMLQDRMEIKLRNLLTATSKPYFARIDFQENEKSQREKLYIGKMALIREEDQELIIVDWRAPIANLYYEGRLGDAHYVSPGGDVEGRLLLKRQFIINDGLLESMADIDITTNDEFLQASLGANADNRLKEIVSTIQEEQNQVIRADMWTPLIVQGAAGSGKTTIALHRIAYLIYTYEKSFKPENFMIIAPNKLFLNYISDILPELGVEKAKQSTFEDFANMIIGQKLKINDANEKLDLFVNHNRDHDQRHENELIRTMCEFKSTMDFRDVLDEFIDEVEKDFIPKEDFKIMNIVLYKYDTLNDLFLNEYKRHPIVKRIDEIKKHMTNTLKKRKNYIIEKFQLQCDERIKELKLTMEADDTRLQIISDMIDRKNEKIKEIENHAKTVVKEYIKKINKIDPVSYYEDFMMRSGKNLLSQRLGEKVAEFVCNYTVEIMQSSRIDIEDLAPIIYLKYKIHGIDEKIPVKHIVIDEAQDFSVFQIYVLKKIIKDSSFTILGDLAQGIHSYRGTRDWDDLIENVFDEGKCKLLYLEQTYRTTVEIAEAANKVIEKLQDTRLKPAKPVIRHGEEVKLIKMNNIQKIAEDIEIKIIGFKSQGYKSVAVICKTLDECKLLLPLLSKAHTGAYIITGKEKEYKSGVVIVPSYLAKGLEFDAVLISDAGKEKYSIEELDAKLLYVAMTRALHKLHIYYTDEISELLIDI